MNKAFKITSNNQYVQDINLPKGSYTFICNVKHHLSVLTVAFKNASGAWFDYEIPCIAGEWSDNVKAVFNIQEPMTAFSMCSKGATAVNPVYMQAPYLEKEGGNGEPRPSVLDFIENLESDIVTSNLNATLINGALSVENESLTEDEGYVEVTIPLGESNLTRRFTVGKNKDGKDGVVILEIIDYYGVSEHQSILPTYWYYTIPQKGASQYLWNYERTNYSDGTHYETPKRVIQGKDARSIQSIRNAYAYSSSDTVSPTGGWQYDLASLGPKPAGYYLWIRDDITYTDGSTSSTVGYVVREGTDGRGVKSVVMWYYKSSSSTQLQSGSWSTVKPDYSTSFFLWSKIITTYTDNTTSETVAILDPEWHKVQAVTDKFGTTTDGGLISTVMMLLRELNSQTETAGISGIQGALRSNPAFWAGGKYEEAFKLIAFLSKMSAGTAPASGEYAGLAKITMLHNGAAKIGDFIIEESGRIVMVDPATGALRLVFSTENLPTIVDLMAGTSSTGSINIGSGSTSTSQALRGTANVAQSAGNGSMGAVTLSASGTGKSDSFGRSSSIYANLVLYRNNVRVRALWSVSLSFTTSSNMYDRIERTFNPYDIALPGVGSYTFKLEVERIGDISSANATSSSFSFAWNATLQGVKRQQYGLDGMMFYYSNNHFYYTESGGLDVRGKTNMPGVLASGTVSAGGGLSNEWGAKINYAQSITGGYRIYLKDMTHNKYSVQVTPHTATTFRVSTKASTYFEILGTGAADFVVFGSNY